MTEHTEPKRPHNEGAVQVDAWGVKVKFQPSAEAYQPPETFGELFSRLKKHLLATLDAIAALPATVGVGSINLVRGVTGLLVRLPNARDHHQAADHVEDAEQAKLPAMQGSGPLPETAVEVAPQYTVGDALEEVEEVLNEIRATTGLCPGVCEAANRDLKIFLVPEAAAEAADKAIEKLSSELDKGTPDATE